MAPGRITCCRSTNIITSMSLEDSLKFYGTIFYCVVFFAILIYIVVNTNRKTKKKEQLNAVRVLDVLTYDDLLSWQYSKDLNDEWFIAVNGSVSSNRKTLLQAKEIKENAPNANIQILHSIFSDDPQAVWNEFRLCAPKNEVTKVSEAQTVLVVGFLLCFLSIVLFPPFIALAAFICGIIAVARGAGLAGVCVIIFSLVCGTIGSILGVAIFSSL